MGHIVDLVFVKELLVDDPWGVCDHLIHPPVPQQPCTGALAWSRRLCMRAPSSRYAAQAGALNCVQQSSPPAVSEALVSLIF